MGKSILITGGARSGKSSFAEKLAKELGGRILYIATAIPFDEEMKDRIRRHKESRPPEWDTFEAYKNLGREIEEKGKEYDVILLDCITVMITNIFIEYPEIDFENPDFSKVENVENEIRREIEGLAEGIKNTDANVILVTNELGCGIVPENLFTRVFRDISGRVNQYIAYSCDEVYVTICGLPLKLK